MAPREDLPGDALSRGVGRMGRVRPPEGEGQAQVSAFRVLHDDRRTLEIKMSGKDGEDILKGGTERLRRGRYGNDPVQGFQIPGQRAIKPVYAFFLHVPQRLEGASPAAGAAVTSQASSCRLLMPSRRWMLRICVLRVLGEMFNVSQMAASGVLRASIAAIIACCRVRPSSRKCASTSSMGHSMRESGVPGTFSAARSPLPASALARRKKPIFSR